MATIKIDPMVTLRAKRKEAVNRNFATLANAHVDQAHALKKQWATSDLDRLQDEATLRGITKEQLAEIILTKSDAVAARELERQKIMIQIDAATTPAELAAINGNPK
jgi:hypothetical protein